MQERQHKPGRAFCPECGQKYAVPEDELKRRAGLRFRATCRNCDTPFSVMWARDELVTEREEILTTDEEDERDVLPQGARVGKYEIEEPLSSGGSSTVYRAFELGANRTVALKVLHQEPDSDYGVRFRREVEVQGNLKHPNLMPIFDQGVVDGKPFYTMELLHKPVTMDAIIRLFRSNRLGYNPSLRTLNSMHALLRQLLLPVTRAIAFTNANGIVHRDLKPTNVLIDGRTLRVYVIDFGICHVFRSTGTRLVLRGGDGNAPHEDAKAHTMGTLRLMPPEQARGEVSPRGDVWALGCLLYYILAGDAPIAPAIDLRRVGLEKRIQNLQKIAASCREAGDKEEAAFYDQRVEELRSGSARSMRNLLQDATDANYQPLPEGTDAGLAAIASKAMSTDPSDRYRNAESFGAEVEAWLSGRPVRAYASHLGPGRAMAYRTKLFVERHRTPVLTTLTIALLAVIVAVAWSFRSASRAEMQLETWLEEARSSEDPELQEDRLKKYLTLRPESAEAQSLLDQARAFKPILKRIREAQDAKVRVRQLRSIGQVEMAYQLASDNAAVLEGSVLPDLLALPDTYPGRGREKEVRELASFLRGRRLVDVRGVAAGADLQLVFPVARGQTELQWDKPKSLGQGPPSSMLPLDPGSYVLVVRLDGRAAYLPLHIGVSSARVLELNASIDPSTLPAGMVPVIGGNDIVFGDLRFQAETYRQSLKPFLIDEHEVTNEQYAIFLESLPEDERRVRAPRREVGGESGRTAPLWDEGPNGRWTPAGEMLPYPVTGISLVDAEAFAAWAGKRLPTREEWEFAAHGVDGRDYPFGDRLDRGVCNAATGVPRAVRSYRGDRSPFGLWDMGGNVAEWIASTGTVGIVKGGSFDLPRYRASVAAFGRRAADRPYADVGFRCVRDLE
ncbi:MAG: SUMF1/EgtB/PvdO family nonheme iron enzyme [Planctomycetota bacterium]